MNDILHPFIDSFAIVYLDNLLVYSDTWEEHISHMMQVLETLKKHQWLESLKKCEFVKQSLVYVRSFIGETQYLRKFITSFSVVTTQLHAITISGKSFQWGKCQQKDFEELKKKTSQALVMALPNLERPFEVETNASGYDMGVVFMQGGRIAYYHSNILHWVIIKYPTYDKELYAMVQVVKKWKHYLMGKDIVIHIDHQSL
eukprot:PITA_34057